MACASASTLAMIGSSTSSGSRRRTRLTRSRTSLAAASMSTSELKRMVMRLDSDAAGRFDDVDALDAGERAFENLGDLRFDQGRRGAGIGGGHRDDRLVDLADIRAP